MSKPVRIYDATYAEIEELAQADRRSVANMVQLILERGLELVLSERERSSDGDTHSVTNPRESEALKETAPTEHSRSPSTGSASSPDDEAGAP